MKTNFRFILGLSIACIISLLSACSKDNSNGNPGPPPSELSFKVDGTATKVASPDSISAFDATNMVASGWTYNNGRLLISARVPMGADTNIMFFSMANVPNNLIGGPYSLNWSALQILTLIQGGANFGFDAVPCVYGSPSKLLELTQIDFTNQFAILPYLAAAGNGTCTITGYDPIKNQITGTFNFNVNFGPQGSATISEGFITNLNKFL